MPDPNLTFTSFALQAIPTKPVPDNELFWALDVAGEAGEFANARKKILRDGERPEHRLNLLEEAGDTLFALVHALAEQGYTLRDAAEYELQKLDHMRGEANLKKLLRHE